MTKKRARLHERYLTTIRGELQKKLGISNIMEVPYLEKIVLNIGVKDAVADVKALDKAEDVLAKISGQKPSRTLARISIAGFKLREGMPIGTKVTLRRTRMYEFLDRLITLALPQVRDLQGVSTKLDRRGNYNLGIRDWVIFPELDNDVVGRSSGMNITIQTSTDKDEHAFELLKAFGVPFRKV